MYRQPLNFQMQESNGVEYVMPVTQVDGTRGYNYYTQDQVPQKKKKHHYSPAEIIGFVAIGLCGSGIVLMVLFFLGIFDHSSKPVPLSVKNLTPFPAASLPDSVDPASPPSTSS